MTRYHVVLESPLGERSGTLTLRGSGDAVTGTLSLLGVDNPVAGAWEGASLVLRHVLRTGLSKLECSTRLYEEDGGLRGTVHSGGVRMPLRGTRLEEEERKGEQSYGTADRP